MGQVLKVLSGIGTGYFILSRIAASLYNKVNYSFGAIRRRDVQFTIVDGRFVAKLPVTLNVVQTTGVTLSSQGLYLVLGQQGRNFGTVSLDQPITIPSGVDTPIRFNLLLDGSDVVDRLQQIVTNPTSLFAAITFRGRLVLSNGWEVPITHSVKF